MLDFITRQANRRPDPTRARVTLPSLDPTVGRNCSWPPLPVITRTVGQNKRRDPINYCRADKSMRL